MTVHRRDERIEPREIVLPACVDEGPWDALPRDRDAEAAQERVILVYMLGVARLRDEIAPAPILPDEGRALEAREKERRENSVARRHARTLELSFRRCRVPAG